MIELTETFIGAAFVVAQEHIGNRASSPGQHRDICDIANFWKHRGTWGNVWTIAGPRDPSSPTKKAVERISGGIYPAQLPMEVGLLGDLAAIVLQKPFDTHYLWMYRRSIHFNGG